MKNPINFSIFKSKLGHMALITTSDSVLKIYLPFKRIDRLRRAIRRDYPQFLSDTHHSLPGWAVPLRDQLIEHINGSVQNYKGLKIDLDKLTPFQIKVLNCTALIPEGTTLTYQQVAKSIHHPKSYRAVGHALSKNPTPLIIPCHRVIASNGLGGFSAESGVTLKKYLLKLENDNLQ